MTQECGEKGLATTGFDMFCGASLWTGYVLFNQALGTKSFLVLNFSRSGKIPFARPILPTEKRM